MTEETKVGTVEAFSFRKGVVKIDGRWIRFGPELEGILRKLCVGNRVKYVAEDRNLKRIEQDQAKPATPKPAETTLPALVVAKPQASPPVSPEDNRSRSIERQVALKAAVELAELFGYKTTNQCLDVAATFAAWIGANGTGRTAADDPAAFL